MTFVHLWHGANISSRVFVLYIWPLIFLGNILNLLVEIAAEFDWHAEASLRGGCKSASKRDMCSTMGKRGEALTIKLQRENDIQAILPYLIHYS